MSLVDVPPEIFDLIASHLGWTDLLKLRLTSATANNALFGVLHTRAATFSKLLGPLLERINGRQVCVSVGKMTAGDRTFSYVCALSADHIITHFHDDFIWDLGYGLKRWLATQRLHTNIRCWVSSYWTPYMETPFAFYYE